MKRSLFIFIAMLLLYACNKPVEVPINGMPNINNDIEKLPLSNRAYNALKVANVNKIRNIINLQMVIRIYLSSLT